MIVEKKVKLVQQILPGKQELICTKETGPLEIIGEEGQFRIHHPNADSATDTTYTQDQSWTLHREGYDSVYQPYNAYDQNNDLVLSNDGNSLVGVETVEIHRLLPGETEEIQSPEPMRIIGGNGVFYVRCENPGVQGPDIPYTTPLITHPQGPEGPVLVFDVTQLPQFQESVALDG
jgi:hypothetical protein